MKAKHKSRFVARFLVTFLVCMLFCGTVFATSTPYNFSKGCPEETYIDSNIHPLSEGGVNGTNFTWTGDSDFINACTVSVKVWDGVSQSYTSASAIVVHKTVNGVSYVITVTPSAGGSANSVHDALLKVQRANGVQQGIQGVESNLGVAADTTNAARAISGVTPYISILSGLIVVLICFGMTLFSAIDCMYIAFPVLRNKMEDAKESGNRMMTKKGSSGETELRWVSDDAQYAISEGTIESGKNKWAIYFKKRVASYIFLAIILFILLSGNISLITNLAVRIVQGLMSVLTSIAG